MSTARYCSIDRHAECKANYCHCDCHQGIEHTPAGLLKLILGGNPEWSLKAACRPDSLYAKHPDTFYAGEGSGDRRNASKQAKRVCARCPVRRECLTEALRSERSGGIAFGIWGGLTAQERHTRNILHLPLSERVRILSELFDAQRETLLTPKERRSA